MSDIKDYINRINAKLQQLLKDHSLLKKENEQLNNRLQKINSAHQQSLDQIAQLQQQVILLKNATMQMGESDKKEFERQINRYIKSIDQCISLLSE